MSKDRSALRNRIEYDTFRIARGLTGLVSPAGLARIGDGIGDVYSMLGGRRREIIDFNLRLAYPEKCDEERRQLARSVTRHFGRSGLDTIRIQRLRPEERSRSASIRP